MLGKRSFFSRLNEIMMTNTRPSLDILVPLVMVDENTTNDENMESLSYEPEKGLRNRKLFLSSFVWNVFCRNLSSFRIR